MAKTSKDGRASQFGADTKQIDGEAQIPVKDNASSELDPPPHVATPASGGPAKAASPS